MAYNREAMFYIGVGGKGIGKTYQTLQIIDSYVKGNPSVGMKPRKVLIFDVNNEYGQYKAINSDQKSILGFMMQRNVECRRIGIVRPDGKIKTSADFQQDLNIILENFKGGAIVLEDLALLVGDATTVSLVGSLSTNRHKDLDVITHFQSIAKFAHPKFKALKNVLRLHKTGDSCTRTAVKSNLGEDYNKVRIAEIMINNRYKIWTNAEAVITSEIKKCKVGDSKKIQELEKKLEAYKNKYKRFFCHVNFDTHKITGAFGREEFEKAAIQFLQEEEKYEITPLLLRKDMKGKSLYTYETALRERLLEMMTMYGNEN